MESPEDMFFYPSAGENAFFAKLKQITDKYPHDLRHYLDLVPVYASGRSIIRQLVHYELFKLTVDCPGTASISASISDDPTSHGTSSSKP